VSIFVAVIDACKEERGEGGRVRIDSYEGRSGCTVVTSSEEEGLIVLRSRLKHNDDRFKVQSLHQPLVRCRSECITRVYCV
jgi:hypothetical protein